MDHRSRSHRPHPRSAFTLIELLVTVTIISVLLSLCLVMVGQVRGAAYRVTCLANMRQWGLAINSYAGDYAGRTPNSIAVWMFGGNPSCGRTPYAMWRTAADGPTSELNLPAMRPYFEGYESGSAVISKPWFCPSTKVANIDSGVGYPVEWLDYTYFAMNTRPDPAWCTDPSATYSPRLNPTGLLLSDRVVHWGAADLWFYNHTRRGSNAGFTSLVQFVGANQLFGDGHAAWKDGAGFGLPAGGSWFGDVCGDHCFF